MIAEMALPMLPHSKRQPKLRLPCRRRLGQFEDVPGRGGSGCLPFARDLHGREGELNAVLVEGLGGEHRQDHDAAKRNGTNAGLDRDHRAEDDESA